MAEDLLDGVLGSGEESSEAAAADSPAGAEAFAAAIAAIASRQDPGVARKTEVFLDKQARLLDLQAQHLEDEHSSRLTHLRLTVAAAKRKRYADRMRNGLYTGIALIVSGVLIAGVRMIAEAMSDHSLVVEDFTAPADFAARGITSHALAEDLASRVAAIRDTANRASASQTDQVRADQSDVLKVEIPETGISVNELERFLHRWLGHQTVLSGQLRDDADGKISMVLHIAGADPIVVRGSGADLDQLTQTAAEKAFAIFDPVNHVIYLEVMGRDAEAYEAAARYAHGPGLAALPPSDQADAYALLANSDPDMSRALANARFAIGIDPGVAIAWLMAGASSHALGHDQAALALTRKALNTKQSDQPVEQRNTYASMISAARISIAQSVGDFASSRSELETTFRLRPQRGDYYYTRSAGIAAALHDVARSREYLDSARVTAPNDESVLNAQWTVSSDAGDWAQALATAKALVADAQARQAAVPARAPYTALQLQTLYRPQLAYAEAMTGDTASATALISQTPADCYLCIRIRGLVAAAAGDAADADRWFAEAVRQAPDLPVAYLEWGQTLLARGDLAGAAREFSLAHAKGPHFADPLKGWGDVLVRQGQPKEALAKYDEALRHAPDWVALKQARNAAAAMSEHRS